MAEGYFRKFSPPDTQVNSAGIEAHGLNQNAVKVMAEDGIDISGHTSKIIDELSHSEFDFVITVCDNAKESCPVFPASTLQIHKSFEDPARFKGNEEKKLDKFREVRDQIKKFTQEFVKERL